MATKKPKKEASASLPEPQLVPQTNVDRLLKHLKKDALATKLVAAHQAAAEGEASVSMKTIIRTRVKEVRDALDKT